MITEPERQRRINIETAELQATAWIDEAVRRMEAGNIDGVFAAMAASNAASVEELEQILTHPEFNEIPEANREWWRREHEKVKGLLALSNSMQETIDDEGDE